MQLTKRKLRSTIKSMCLGTTTMGARGQVVVPAEARRVLKLKPGDRLMVFVKFGKALGFIKTQEMASFVNHLFREVSRRHGSR